MAELLCLLIFERKIIVMDNNFNEQNNNYNYEPNPVPDYSNVQWQPQPEPTNSKNDTKSIGLNVLAWFVPVFGLIYYLCQKGETPVRAKSVGKTALISFVVNMILTIIGTILIISTSYSIFKNLAPLDYSDQAGTSVSEEYKETEENFSFDIEY